MKHKISLFTGLIVAALCLAAPSSMRAQDSDSQSDSTTRRNGGGITLDQVLPPGHPSIDSDTTNSTPDASQPGSSSSSTAAQTDPNQIPTPVNRASHLIGMTVKNPQNQTLGKIRDVVFDLKTGRVSYVVLEKAGRNRGTGSDLAVPLSAFTPSADRQNLVLNSDRTRIQTSTGFSGNNLPSMSNPAFGAQAEQPVRREILIVPVPMSPNQENPHHPSSPSPDSDQGPKTENP
jgi:sporulation protein YlmC with PRC-barrel domain